MAARTDDEERVVLNTTEARQGGRPRAMLWVLLISLGLAVIAGLALGLGWISLPSLGLAP